MIDPTNPAETPRRKKRQDEMDEDSGAAFAIVPLLIVNLLFLLPVLGWLGSVFTNVPERLLDRTLGTAVFGVLLAMKANPEGWRDMFRLATGSLLFTAFAALATLATGMALMGVLSLGVQETYADELAWGPMIAVLLLYFPAESALARLGLLPGFRPNSGETESPDELQPGERPPPPAWLPRGTGHRLPAIILVMVAGAFAPVLVKLLAQSWPGSALPLLDSMSVSFLVFAAGLTGFFLTQGTAWLAKLANTLLTTGAMTAIVIVVALLLPMSPDREVPGGGLLLHGLPIAIALPFFLFATRHILRRERERRGPNDAENGEDGKPTDRESS